MYQFIEGGVDIIADHLGPPLGVAVGVWPQMRDHIGIRVRAVDQPLLRREKGCRLLIYEPTVNHHTIISCWDTQKCPKWTQKSQKTLIYIGLNEKLREE